MKQVFTRRLCWLLWLGGLAFFVALALYPVSTRATRAGEIGLLAMLLGGFLALVWASRAVRGSVLGLLGAGVAFLVLPVRPHPDAAGLRADFLASLNRYTGVTYVWGGESIKGIDCSGLPRCGLMNAMCRRGLRTFDPGLVRQALFLWWNDCTAQALGEEYKGLTIHRFDVPDLNTLDSSRLQPGDLAVTRPGVHVMTYLGDDHWIEADPDAGKVINVKVPAPESTWFNAPMRIMRWRVLSDESGP